MKIPRDPAKSPSRDTLRELASTLPAQLHAFPAPPGFRTEIPFVLPVPQILCPLRVRLPTKFVAANGAIATAYDSALRARQFDRARFSVSCLGGIRECRETPSGKPLACSRQRQRSPPACRKGG